MFFHKKRYCFHLFFKFHSFCQLFSKEFEKTQFFFKIHLKKKRKKPGNKNRVFFKPGFITLPTLFETHILEKGFYCIFRTWEAEQEQSRLHELAMLTSNVSGVVPEKYYDDARDIQF